MGDFDDLANELRELEGRAAELDGENEIHLGELFNDGFMRRYTDFGSLEEFFDASPWTVETEEDLEAIPDDEADRYVDEHTRFPNWEEMMGEAAEEWTVKQLGL